MSSRYLVGMHLENVWTLYMKENNLPLHSILS